MMREIAAAIMLFLQLDGGSYLFCVQLDDGGHISCNSGVKGGIRRVCEMHRTVEKNQNVFHSDAKTLCMQLLSRTHHMSPARG